MNCRNKAHLIAHPLPLPKGGEKKILKGGEVGYTSY